jgi:hypothetical protein
VRASTFYVAAGTYRCAWVVVLIGFGGADTTWEGGDARDSRISRQSVGFLRQDRRQYQPCSEAAAHFYHVDDRGPDRVYWHGPDRSKRDGRDRFWLGHHTGRYDHASLVELLKIRRLALISGRFLPGSVSRYAGLPER